ncbi:hypothetical protein [Ornithinimicrobium sp. INDO-MA30-4]|uniref:hypothetical protein n=1 Tax=Ornithinimicrobium sp. INDO-MA30-4 TaxID=2908651 RepID=UPI0028830D05|nr:hypothetical protein [Ornithinimicrobium sp. INDO-MA30-4]
MKQQQGLVVVVAGAIVDDLTSPTNSWRPGEQHLLTSPGAGAAWWEGRARRGLRGSAEP